MGTLTSVTSRADNGIGGICYVLLAPLSDVSVYVDDTTGETAFTSDSSLSSVFTKFVMTKETANYTSAATGTPTTGTVAYAQTLNLTFSKNETVKRNNLKVMGQNELVAVAVDRNGTAVCLGNDGCNGLDMTAGDFASGAGPSDLNGTTITLMGNFPQPPSMVTDASLADLLNS